MLQWYVLGSVKYVIHSGIFAKQKLEKYERIKEKLKVLSMLMC